MIKNLDKKLLNYLVIVLLSLVSFSWTAFIFETSFRLNVILTVILVRIICSALIFKDHTMSWSKATQITFIIKSIVYGTAFIIYMPVLYGQARIAFLMSEAFTFLLMINFMMYAYYYIRNRNKTQKTSKVIIYGAGNSGAKLAEDFRQGKYRVRYFVDDNPGLENRSIDGKKILSAKGLKNRLDKGYEFQMLVVAMPDATEARVKEIFEEFAPYFEKIKVLPSLDRILGDADFTEQLKDITLEDLLARNPKDLDKNVIGGFIRDMTILVTGAGGSIGSEICRQCARYGAKKLILVDHSEFNLYSITDELAHSNIVSVLLSVTDREKLHEVFLTHKPNIVLHAAAYKHVPLCEENVTAAVENNVLGTKNVADIAVETGVKKMILISSDKAVRPTNVMGATKRICELYVQNLNSRSTDMIAVRFGNVLGSSGSVIPKFKSQIEHGGPVTVTHPEITRFFMLIPEACELVLQAGAIGKGGDIFILDMGEPIKIADLAQKMITLSGAKNIQIEYTGLRPGEKLYEELLINDTDVRTQYQSIMVAKATKYDIDRLNKDIDELIETDDKIAKIKEILPGEFQHS